VVFLDSQSAIHLTKNDAYHSKTKHISVKYHNVRDTVIAGEIAVRKVHTLENPADMLIKPFSIAKFKHRLDLVGFTSFDCPSGLCPSGCFNGVRELVLKVGLRWRLLGFMAQFLTLRASSREEVRPCSVALEQCRCRSNRQDQRQSIA